MKIGKDEIYVAKVCPECETLFIIDGSKVSECNRIYCKNECKNRYHRALYKNKYTIGKGYLRKHFKKRLTEQKIEALGTYATASGWHQCPPDKLVRDKDNKPDFDAELNQVKRIKDRTFKAQDKNYSITEGDRIRRIKVDEYE